MGLYIISTGKALPKKCVSNEDFTKLVDTSDEWIRTRTGIRSRYKCEDESNTDLAVAAAREALKKSDIDKNEIGAVIVATSTADYAFPSTAALVQKELELPEEVIAFDLTSACTGFLHSLSVAHGILMNQDKKYALIVGSERLSSVIDYTDRSTCILFGDGAGAAVVGLNENKFHNLNWTRGNLEVLSNKRGEIGISMKGNDVFKFAVTVMEDAINKLLEKANMTIADVDYVVCHQANERIIAHVQKKYKGYEDKFFINLYNYGNTSAASIPIALEELMASNKISKESKILCVGFGAGLSWSAALIG